MAMATSPDEVSRTTIAAPANVRHTRSSRVVRQ
jgi:hypothetical protein